MTQPDPNETSRTPTPDAEAPATEGWPGSTDQPPVSAESELANAPALGTPPADEAGRSGPRTDEAASSPPPTVAGSRRRDEPDHGRAASIAFGLILLGVGIWFFAEQTLGLELPRIRWSQFWPVALIGLGVWIVLGSMRRGSR